MAGFTRDTALQLRVTLQDATIKCSERCLYQSAKWAAELSASLSPHLEDQDGEETEPDSPMNGDDTLPTAPSLFSSNPDPKEALLESQESHKYLLAKSYFDCREFERCSAVFLPSGIPKVPLSRPKSPATTKSPRGKGKQPRQLSDDDTESESTTQTTLPKLSQKALFLALYAKYMAGEKRKDEESEMILGPADRGSAINMELVGISKTLDDYFSSRGPLEQSGGWLEYLYGIVLAKNKIDADARQWLIRSITLFPYNWGAWLELNSLIGSIEELREIETDLPPNLMSLIFHLYANQELYQSSGEIHEGLSKLEGFFPGSHFIKTQRALLYYHSKDFDEAEAIFSSILHEDPFRIDSLDHYSNILYVMTARPKLAFLAQLATATDKFRPETCCVVGNYYSLKSEHEKAIQYFRRALILDRTFLSAWTLMGHEYVEMKNTHAAIESYRRAVDVNRKDYRAWYGLGQTYEVLEMHLYALFYFQRAASLRPFDSKMWHAVGSCYDKVGRPLQSIKAYKRALVAGTFYDTGSSFGSSNSLGTAPDAWMVSETLFNIATMYERLGNIDEAAEYMEMTLAQEEGTGEDEDDDGNAQGIGVTHTTSKARMWLARWEFAKGGLERAMELVNELCQDGVEVEEAKALIRDVRARMESGT